MVNERKFAVDLVDIETGKVVDKKRRKAFLSYVSDLRLLEPIRFEADVSRLIVMLNRTDYSYRTKTVRFEKAIAIEITA